MRKGKAVATDNNIYDTSANAAGYPGQGAGRGVTTSARVINEPQWPQGGFTMTKFPERNFNVNAFTGQRVSSVGTGQWARGDIVRAYSPSIHPPMLGYYAYDPTDPTSWSGNAN
jgi:hypothetical protein